MFEVPEPRYIESNGIELAYQVVGDSARNVVLVNGLVPNLDEADVWESWLSRVPEFARLVRFDRRGQGLSSRAFDFGTIEDRMDDIRIVMDATSVERAVLLAEHDSVCMALLFAATYPERVTGLVLSSVSAPKTRWATDYPIGLPGAFLDQYTDWVRRNWGTGRVSAGYAPPDFPPENLRILARMERAICTPAMAAEHFRLANDMDVRDVIASVQVPALIIHGRTQILPIAWARYLAEHLHDATLIEDAGNGLIGPEETVGPLIDAIEEFVTGERPRPIIDTHRVLATVLFVDIVTSTERLVDIGDRRWGELVSEFRRRVRIELDRYQGREINYRGDDVLATFDGSTRAVRCAQAIAISAHSLGVEVRAGAHTGEVEIQGDDIAGLAVNTGARVCALASAGEVLVTSTLRDLVAGSGLEFEPRGPHHLKGIPGEVQLFAVAPTMPKQSRI